jgi:hypothetical protein
MNRSMQTVETLFAELRVLKIGDYRTRGPHMPLELASTIKAVCDVFACAGPEERTYQPRTTIILFCFSLVRKGDGNSGHPTKFATSECRWSNGTIH